MAMVKIANVNEVPEGGGKEYEVQGRIIALYKYNGSFYAMGGICLHKGGPLADGELDGNVVTCPLHNWRYDITTGKCLNAAGGVQSFRTQTEGNEVFIEI